MAGWQPPAADAVAAPPPAWVPPDEDAAPQGGGLPVLTDDGNTGWLNGQQAQPVHEPGIIERVGNALAHPVQTVQDAWNYPGYIAVDAPKGLATGVSNTVADAARIPMDAASGKVDLNNPNPSSAGRMLSAALLASPVSPASIGSTLAKTGAPSGDAIFTAGDKGFKDWNNSGLEYPPQQFADWALQQQQGLYRDGIKANDTGAPNLHSEFNDMGATTGVPPGAINLTPADLNAQRKAFSNVARNGINSTERSAAAGARGDYMGLLGSALTAGNVAGAAPAEAAQGLKDAVGNWATGSRSEFLQTLGDNADLRSSASHSGHAGGNPLRQAVASALRTNPTTGLSLADRQGYNQPELGALHAVVEGTPLANQVRTAANMTGGGLGHAGLIGALLAAREGYDVAGIPGALVGGGMPFAGAGMRAWDRRITQDALDRADNLVRSRSPLAQQQGVSATTQPVFPSFQNKLIRALAAQQGQQQQPY